MRMEVTDFLELAKEKIAEYNYMGEIEPQNVLIVWTCKTIQNMKAILTTTVSDGKIFEATYNGEADELYIDEYVKNNKQTYKDVVKKFLYNDFKKEHIDNNIDTKFLDYVFWNV